MKIFFAFLLVMIVTCSCQFSKQGQAKAKAEETCDKFMDTFVQGKFSDAIQYLKQVSNMDLSLIDSMTKTVNFQMGYVMKNYGKITGYQFVQEKEIKDFAVQRTYILRFQNYFLRFNFTLYNGYPSWVITHFNYDEDTNSLFK